MSQISADEAGVINRAIRRQRKCVGGVHPLPAKSIRESSSFPDQRWPFIGSELTKEGRSVL